MVGFVFALSLTALLSHVGKLVIARDRVKFSWLSSLSIFSAMLLVYVNWLAMWELHVIKNWDVLSITALMLFTLSVAFVCMVAAPKTWPEKSVDLEQFYWRQHKVFYSSWLICVLLAILTNFLLLDSPTGSKLLQENLLNLIMLPPILLALLVSARWAQWFGLCSLILTNFVFLVLFESQIN